MTQHRQSTGLPRLDDLLGGGLLPGTLTVVAGATGIGKTQLGVAYAQAGAAQEQRHGCLFDMTARGDSQSHQDYARRMFGWEIRSAPENDGRPLDVFAPNHNPGEYLHVFRHSGRRVTRRDLEFEDWQAWKQEVAVKLGATIAFLYGNFIGGVRRVVVDGVEPSSRASESIQLELFEYIYHQVLRKESEWVARDLLRERYRINAQRVAEHHYNPADVGCLLLYTTHETMLEPLIERPLEEGDLLANANTIIYLGKTREAGRMGRALYIAKHRGSAASDQIVPYTIDDRGLVIA